MDVFSPVTTRRASEPDLTDGTLLRVTTSTTQHGARIVAVGEIDVTTAHLLDAALTSAIGRSRSLDLDLSGVTFMGSAGLHSLIGAQRRLSAHQTIDLVATSAAVRRLLDLVGLTDLFVAADGSRRVAS